MTRITLDLESLVSEGRLTATEAERLKSMAVTGRGISTVVQVLYILGALGLAGGVMILKPDPATGMALAALAIGFALFAQATKREDFGLLGTAMGICGTIGLAGSIGMQFDGSLPPLFINAIIAVVTVAGALVLRSRFLAALGPLAFAALLGSSTQYWHASYGIMVKEPLITTVVFAVLSGGLFLAAYPLKGIWSQMATVAGRVSWLVMNFGFWVGSLWGDYLGDFFETLPAGTPIQDFDGASMFIPDGVFIIAWAAVSVAAIIFMHRNRFAVNASITFLAINVYTQFYEWFGSSGFVMLTGGITLLAFAFGLYHFDRWMVARNKAAAGAA
jgi:iron complex transport system permease protein